MKAKMLKMVNLSQIKSKNGLSGTMVRLMSNVEKEREITKLS